MQQDRIQGLVTIAVPTYNRASSYLRSTLDSLLAQTYEKFEIVISDNASLDATEAVCREYAKKDHRIRYIRQKENIGPLANFNFLRTQIRGEYFLQGADDDLWAPSFLEKCVALLDMRSDAIMAGTNFVEFDDGGHEIAYNPKLFHPFEDNLFRRLRQFIRFYESDAKVMFLYAGVWRSRFIMDDALPQIYWGWDMNFVYRGLTKGTFAFVDEVLFKKRMNRTTLDLPKQKSFPRRIFDSFMHSRINRIFSPFFWSRMRYTAQCTELSVFEKTRLIGWNFFAMSRLFWSRKI